MSNCLCIKKIALQNCAEALLYPMQFRSFPRADWQYWSPDKPSLPSGVGLVNDHQESLVAIENPQLSLTGHQLTNRRREEDNQWIHKKSSQKDPSIDKSLGWLLWMTIFNATASHPVSLISQNTFYVLLCENSALQDVSTVLICICQAVVIQ
jgi:hypothetical protein